MALDMSFPRRPIMEAFLAGAWRSLTVRQSPAMTITRGRKDWSAKPSPSLWKFTLDDTDGDYNPADAMGAYYGHEFLNAPARLALEVGTDAFTRTVASGWGDSPQNGAWSAATNGSGTSAVSSNEGRHVISATSTFQRNTLETISVKDLEVRVSVTIDGVSNVTGGPLEPANIMLRSQNANADYYMCRMVVTTAEQVQLSIMVRDSVTVAGPITLGTAYTGQQWRVAAHMEAGTIRFKAWPAATDEPLDWQISTIRQAPFGPGWPGIRSGVGASNTNTPVTFRYDNLELRLNRMHGEVSQWKPDRDLAGVDKTVSVEVSGLSRRLSTFKKPLRSSLYRYATTTSDLTPAEYWPMDERPDATILGASHVGSAPVDGTSAIKWGAETGLAGIGRAPSVADAGHMTVNVTNSALATSWSVFFVYRQSDGSDGSDAFVSLWTDDTVGSFDLVSIDLQRTGTYEIVFWGSPTTLFSGTIPQSLREGWHTISLTAERDGASATDFYLSIDGATPVGVGASPATYAPLYRMDPTAGLDGSGAWALGQFLVFPEPIYSNNIAQNLHNAAFGHLSEGAVTRALRLGAEQGIPVEYRGDPTLPALVGAQREKTFLELFDECAAVDRGSRYEPKGANAIALRTVDSTMRQNPVVELDYAAGQVAEPFHPITDDQGVVNDVTAKRPNGGEYRHERTVGPKNTADPGTLAGAVGRSDGDIDTNTATDAGLPGQAEWRVSLGTVDAPRGPVHVDLTAPDISAAQAALVMDVNVDDLIVVNNAAGAGLHLPYRVLARGYTETINTAFVHRIGFNCTPARPYDVFILGTSLLAGGTDKGAPSQITVAVDDNDVTLTVASTVNAVWKTGAQTTQALLGGEQVTITNVTGATSPQTVTVTRSVNGVVRGWAAGTTLEILSPGRLKPS